MPSWMNTALLLCCGVCLGLSSRSGSAGDWPQILGPNRDGRATDEKLLTNWGSSGPATLWQIPVGDGFAGVAVQGSRVAEFSRQGAQEVVRLLDAVTGKVFWTSASPCNYRGGVSSDKGPRCVPLIHQDRVYVFGVEGLLRCLSLSDGAEIWKVDTTAQYEPLEGYFGVGSTPVISGNRIIVNVGGRDNSAIVAFDTGTGKAVWQAFDDAASYSSPRVVVVGGVAHALVVTRLHVVSLDPATGAVRFQLPFGMRGPTVNGASPVLVGNQLFLSASYRIGSLLAGIGRDGANEVWRDEELLATQFATPIAVGNTLFAVDGRQDEGRGAGSLKCIDTTARKVLWQKSGFDYGTLLFADNQLLFLTSGGELIQFDASTKNYVERQRAAVLEATDSGYRLPALSSGRLFVRDDSTLKCLKVGDIR